MKNIRLILTITIIALISTVNTNAKTIVTDGLVAYWTFDQGTIIGRTVKDVWDENDATLVGNPKRVEGYVKGGLELDGDGDYVSLPNVGNFGRKIGQYTFEAWIKTTLTKRWSVIYRVIEQPCRGWRNGNGILINCSFGFDDAADIMTAPDWINIEWSRRGEKGRCRQSGSGRVVPVSDGEWHQIVYTTRLANEAELEERRQHFIQVGIPIELIGVCYKNTVYIDGTVIMEKLYCSNIEDPVAYVEPIFLGAVNYEGKASGFLKVFLMKCGFMIAR